MKLLIASIGSIALLLGAPGVLSQGLEVVEDVLGSVMDAQGFTTFTTNWGSSNCSAGAQAGYYTVTDTVAAPGEAYTFLGNTDYDDCSWNSDPLSVSYQITHVGVYHAGPADYTCGKTSDSWSQGDDIFDNSVTFDLSTNCVMDCDNQFDVNTYYSITAKGSDTSQGQPHLYNSCTPDPNV